ncbi:hypothetical protein C8Q70DRAFT_1059652 [Cubamyces menziesii]|nr:hypothetical protein C8Q70DRAFT_1059652 [Cubamyces menziesii]
MVSVKASLAVLALAVSRGLTEENRDTLTPSFPLTAGVPGQTQSAPEPTQCADTCFVDVAKDVGCQELSNTSCLCSGLKAGQVISKATLCLQTCPGETANALQYYEQVCADLGNLPPGQSTGLFPSIPASDSTLITFSSSATGGGHGVGTESTRIVPTATAAPTTVTVTDNASKGVSTAIPSPVGGNSVKAGDGVSTAAPASDAQDASGAGNAVTQTVTDELSSNTSAPGVNSHINAGARVQRSTVVGFFLAGLCGILGMASVL